MKSYALFALFVLCAIKTISGDKSDWKKSFKVEVKDKYLKVLNEPKNKQAETLKKWAIDKLQAEEDCAIKVVPKYAIVMGAVEQQIDECVDIAGEKDDADLCVKTLVTDAIPQGEKTMRLLISKEC